MNLAQITKLRTMFAELKTLPINKQMEAKEQILSYVENVLKNTDEKK